MVVRRSFFVESLEIRRLFSGGVDKLVNDNAGATGTSAFTQSNAALVSFFNTIVVAYNDSGSGGNHFTGFARSTDSGATFSDGGALPSSTAGDGGEPVMVRDPLNGRLILATIDFGDSTLQVFHSDNSGVSWSAPVNGSPGHTLQDKPRLAIDTYQGVGQDNDYLVARQFGSSPGIYCYTSQNSGNSFSSGVLVAPAPSAMQGAFVVVAPDHSVDVFWYEGTAIKMARSVNQGASFGSPVTVFSGLVGGLNGDLGLTGTPQGGTAAPIRTNEFPHVAVNPISGDLYVTYNNKGSGTDKAEVFLVQSSNGGTTWSTPLKINDDSTSTDQWTPTVAVTPDGLRLGVSYYSRQEDPTSDNLFRYYSRLANINGSTLSFAASSPVSDVASLPEMGRDSLINPTYMGDDYTVGATTNAGFQVAWSDNRSDLTGGAGRKDPNVYFDTVATPGVWTGAGDGSSWSDANNWSDHQVPSASTDVVIDVVGSYTVNLTTSATVKSLTLGSTTVGGPTLFLTFAGNHVLKTGSLSITGSARLDLNNNDLIVDYSAASPLSALQGLINAARAGGAWTGFGLTSSSAKNNALHNTTLGAMEAGDYRALNAANTTFDGVAIDTTAVLIKYTWYGDTDFNGKVNFDDYVRTDSGFNNHRSGWLNGDFDGNGAVNFDDYVLIDLAFNTQSGTLRR